MPVVKEGAVVADSKKLSIIILFTFLAGVFIFNAQQVIAQPNLPSSTSASRTLEDPNSSSFTNDIFFEDYNLDANNTLYDTTDITESATTNEIAGQTPSSANQTITVADSGTGADTATVTLLAGALSFITLSLIKKIKK